MQHRGRGICSTPIVGVREQIGQSSKKQSKQKQILGVESQLDSPFRPPWLQKYLLRKKKNQPLARACARMAYIWLTIAYCCKRREHIIETYQLQPTQLLLAWKQYMSKQDLHTDLQDPAGAQVSQKAIKIYLPLIPTHRRIQKRSQ